MKTAKDKKAAAAEEVMQLVTFRVGSEEYGLDIRFITEVVRPLKITPLPRMPEFVEGVVNLRGVIIPIVDLRRRFALRPVTDNQRAMRMMITKGAVSGGTGAGRELLGLVVDRVDEVIHVPKNNIEQAPEAATGEAVDFITGMAKVGDRLIIMLDITKILSQQERSALAEAGDAGY
ncbi:MAG TPA: chemotaxis protein CheW [Nitrospirota bacterium]